MQKKVQQKFSILILLIIQQNQRKLDMCFSGTQFAIHNTNTVINNGLTCKIFYSTQHTKTMKKCDTKINLQIFNF